MTSVRLDAANCLDLLMGVRSVGLDHVPYAEVSSHFAFYPPSNDQDTLAVKATLLPLHSSHNRVNTRSISGENTTSQIGFAINNRIIRELLRRAPRTWVQLLTVRPCTPSYATAQFFWEVGPGRTKVRHLAPSQAADHSEGSIGALVLICCLSQPRSGSLRSLQKESSLSSLLSASACPGR